MKALSPRERLGVFIGLRARHFKNLGEAERDRLRPAAKHGRSPPRAAARSERCATPCAWSSLAHRSGSDSGVIFGGVRPGARTLLRSLEPCGPPTRPHRRPVTGGIGARRQKQAPPTEARRARPHHQDVEGLQILPAVRHAQWNGRCAMDLPVRMPPPGNYPGPRQRATDLQDPGRPGNSAVRCARFTASTLCSPRRTRRTLRWLLS